MKALTTLCVAVLAYGLIAITATEAHYMSWTSYKATAKDPKQPKTTAGEGYLNMAVIKDNTPPIESYTPTHQFNGELRLRNTANVVAVHLRLGPATTQKGSVALKLWPTSGSATAQPLTIAGQLTIPFRIMHNNTTSNKLSAAAGDIDSFTSKLATGNVYLSVATTAYPNGQIRGQTQSASETYCAGLPSYLIDMGYVSECKPNAN